MVTPVIQRRQYGLYRYRPCLLSRKIPSPVRQLYIYDFPSTQWLNDVKQLRWLSICRLKRSSFQNLHTVNRSIRTVCLRGTACCIVLQHMMMKHHVQLVLYTRCSVYTGRCNHDLAAPVVYSSVSFKNQKRQLNENPNNPKSLHTHRPLHPYLSGRRCALHTLA